jgi:hypothetical protein
MAKEIINKYRPIYYIKYYRNMFVRDDIFR